VDCSGCGPGCTADRIRAQGLFQAEGLVAWVTDGRLVASRKSNSWMLQLQQIRRLERVTRSQP
jgi:hypothetical protein